MAQAPQVAKVVQALQAVPVAKAVLAVQAVQLAELMSEDRAVLVQEASLMFGVAARMVIQAVGRPAGVHHILVEALPAVILFHV